MFKSLYDQFAHWYHGGSIYLYSDPHFSDEEMKHIRRNYIGDDEQVRRINSKIGKNDTLIILGDVGNVEFVKKLRGYKVLVMGNHDAGATNYKRQTSIQEEVVPTMHGGLFCKEIIKNNHLFDEVYEGALFISDKIVLSHEPIDLPFALNIHGHDHSMWSGTDPLHFNVCAEHINYTPVCLKNIIESGILKKIPSIHRITIDQATARKKSRK